MPKSHPQPGPTGRRVAEQITALRTAARLSKTDLVTRLADAGRPLSIDVVIKIERGVRPVDVDDLIALALALEVDPLRLMFGDQNEEIDVTPTWSTSATGARLWAQGSTYGGLGDTDQARRVRTLIAQLHNEFEEGSRGDR